MVRGQRVNLARMPGLHPYFFSKDILEFLLTTESRPRFNVSSERRCFFDRIDPHHYTGALGPTQTAGVSTSCWSHLHLFQQQPSFPRRSPIQVLTMLSSA